MPGVGPVTANRIAFSLLDRRRESGLLMAKVIEQALTNISQCPNCHNYCDKEGDMCEICKSARRRENRILCVVESPLDVSIIEESGSFNGTYYVLHGHLSPIDGIGPDELGLHTLALKIKNEGYTEVILALSQTVEGNATAAYIRAMCKKSSVKLSTIASGVPIGGDLESVDKNTLKTSFDYRREL